MVQLKKLTDTAIWFIINVMSLFDRFNLRKLNPGEREVISSELSKAAIQAEAQKRLEAARRRSNAKTSVTIVSNEEEPIQKLI